MTLSTTHKTATIQQLIKQYRHRELNLAPAFQRMSVWSNRDRQKLIESLLQGIPIPSIFLAKRQGKGGRIVYDVIDGKQRIETILLFMGKGPLAVDEELWLHAPLGDEPASWWTWRDLDSNTRHRFLSTSVPVVEVEGGVPEITTVFVAINSTGRRLTSAERRHANFLTNSVLRSAQQLSDRYATYLTRHNVVSPSQARRMRHVELMTELLLSFHACVPLNKKSSIDKLLSNSDAFEPRAIRAAERDLKRTLNIVDVVLPNLRSTRFRQITDFYTLVLTLHRMRTEGYAVSRHDSARNALAGSLLTSFGHEVDRLSEQLAKGHAPRGTLEEPYRAYLMTVKEGTDSSANRLKRERLLREVLCGVFEELDTTRRFNAVQRRVLWNASARKRCTKCRGEITRWEDMDADHVQPFVKGGRTKLSNAAITHRNCNRAAGARARSAA